jgi:hypothetical protein
VNRLLSVVLIFKKSAAPAHYNDRIKIRQTQVCHAVAFWLELHPDERVNISTMHSAHSNHWKQALQFFAEEFQLPAGDSANLKVTQNTTGFEFGLEMESAGHFFNANYLTTAAGGR